MLFRSRYLFVQPDGLEERYICELSYAQKKIFNLGRAKSTIVTMSETIEQTIVANNKLREELTGCKDE